MSSRGARQEEWKIRIVTFNVAMRPGTEESARELIKREREGRDEEMLIIGLQVRGRNRGELAECENREQKSCAGSLTQRAVRRRRPSVAAEHRDGDRRGDTVRARRQDIPGGTKKL